MSKANKLVVENEVKGVTAEMIDWWWDNMGPTERYKLWHPRDHISFEWEVSPAENGHVGAIQVIDEYLGSDAIRIQKRIRWDDPKDVPIPTIYSHVLLATGFKDDAVTNRLIHEYEDAADGVRIRSTWLFNTDIEEVYLSALRQHCIEEMQGFPHFLPALYLKETCSQQPLRIVLSQGRQKTSSLIK